MKKLFLFIFILTFCFSWSQTISIKIKELENAVYKAYESESDEMKTFIVNSENGKLYQVKTDNLYSEFDFSFENVYDILRKDDKIVYIRKSPESDIRGTSGSYDYFFDNEGKLIGVENFVSSFLGSEVVYYLINYELNEKTEKIEVVKETFITAIDGKPIEKNSKLYKEIMKDSSLLNYIKGLDKITFTDLEGFMKVEKLKYYK